MAILASDNHSMANGSHLRKVLARNLAERMAAIPDCDTQAKLSKRARVGQSHVSRILRCESAATVDMLESIAAALGCMAWELLADDEGARKEALARMLLGPAASDLRVASVLPPSPRHSKK